MGTFRSHLTPTVENYLGVIYTLNRDGETVIGRRLADWLEVSAPTVTATIKRMIEHGWVTMGDKKSIHLTQKGREAAISVLQRHMLAELLLVRVLGVPWSKVHEEADRLEHDLSPETTERVARILKNPDVCPHGNPMPGHEDTTGDLLPLLEAEPGRDYVLVRVHEKVERNSELMAYLERNCLIPGATIRIVEVMPFNETIVLQSADKEIVLGLSAARGLWLKPPSSGSTGRGLAAIGTEGIDLDAG